jgi:hypothetical protein
MKRKIKQVVTQESESQLNFLNTLTGMNLTNEQREFVNYNGNC